MRITMVEENTSHRRNILISTIHEIRSLIWLAADPTITVSKSRPKDNSSSSSFPQLTV